MALVACAACTSPVRWPPRLGPDAPDAERRRVYGEYRLVRLDDDTVAQGNELLDVGQVRRLSEGCAEASTLLPARPIMPIILGVAGAGLLGVGVTREVLEPDDINLAVIGAGAAVAATAIILELMLNPSRRDMNAITAAYNRCLRDEVNATRPPSVDTTPLPLGDPRPGRQNAPTILPPPTSSSTTTGG